ncbi:phospholipid-transporting ATPase VB-like [Biomphalaria glabrata]|uniref:Phospholipid-transporting ATPase n=1 Tax=Biomphalaria glabrata TaxID=6526 RepID=A0A9W3B3P5_BIOGL|nr:phospholipid-transporting ATPase VB-like [Biomphalaria glabrata]XP_055894089.1 phospholipid-transporting ATPase VB-like [Biomphalaria glabrata]XP_055894090.1 phospholipid-transporting ATPase VB-like [Biomphalaria glabrata]
MGNILRRCWPNRGIKPSMRTVVPNHTVDPAIDIKNKLHPNFGYKDNAIKTTRYTILTFFPKNLFEQFHRFANIYFIFVVALNWIPQVNAFAKEVAALPVLFVLAVTAAKDAFEDFRRYRSDKQINSRTCRIFSRSEQRYVKMEWSKVTPGDFIHLSCNEIIPADILFIRSSDAQGICHIETSNIDGESNLKQRQVVEGLAQISETEGLVPTMFPYSVDIEQPNIEIYSFRGFVKMESGSCTLRNNNLLQRGCVIRNTDYIEGMVVYAGAETKAMLNNKGPRHKISKLESKINRDVIWCVILLLFLCFFCAIGSGIWLDSYDLKDNTNLVPFISFTDQDQYNPLYQGFIVFWTYIIIFQSVIPLPLYVSVELVKLGQIYFIMQDIEMYDAEKDKPMECRALNITEDLGQIEYIFSDKTGTLTENRMEFKSCTVGGVNYHHMPYEEISQSDFDSYLSMAGLSRSSSIVENLQLDPALEREISNMCLRSLESIDVSIPEHVRNVQEFFLLMAICNTVVVSYLHSDNMDDSGFVPNLDMPKSDFKLPPAHNKIVSGTVSSLSVSDCSDHMSEGSVTGSSFLSDGSQKMHYEAESPDELALVKAANTYGCKLLKRSPGKVKVLLPGQAEEAEFEVLNVLPFDANRKRMSVIVRHPTSREIILYVKGADSCIMNVLHKKYEENEEYKHQLESTKEYLESYALRGLRTLCMAKRVLPEKEYLEWAAEFKKAEDNIDNRDELVSQSCAVIERDLELLGGTGIEDKLQEGVPQTIANLRKAGIKVWVLTGDKQETAIQIAYACQLFSRDQHLLTINANSIEETREKLDEALAFLRSEVAPPTDERTLSRSMISLLSRSATSLRSIRHGNNALVIDGPTLNFATNPELEKRFLKICMNCQSVVCCRATPIQKAVLVKLVRDKLKKLTLSIGDGANDVSMIQTADIGVGISGQEGMQAVMASDFAISKFKFLERLLLVHGHWNHERLARFAAIMFYKSLLSVFVLFWFQFFSGFSGSLMIDSLYLTMQHVIFTAAPPLAIGIFDKDLSAETLLSEPILYRPGQRGDLYTQWTFLVVTLDSIYQSLIIYFFPHLAYLNNSIDIWEFGTTIDVCMILCILLHMSIETNSWVWIQWGSVVLSFFLFWSFLLISNAVFFTFDHPSNPYWVMENTIASASHSLIVVLTCFVSLLPRLVFRSLQISLWPNEIGVARQIEKQREQETEQESSHPTDTDSQTTDNSCMTYAGPNQQSVYPPHYPRHSHPGFINRGFQNDWIQTIELKPQPQPNSHKAV